MVLPNAFAVPVMLSSVNAALPVIAADIRLTALELSWVPTAYLMASSMFVLVFGRLADMWGRKKVFLIGAGTVIVSSLVASMASTGVELVFARFLQGFGAAMLYATQMALISSVFPKDTRGQAISWVISLIYVGLAVGPLLARPARSAAGRSATSGGRRRRCSGRWSRSRRKGRRRRGQGRRRRTVSYTHLTLPTNREV